MDGKMKLTERNEIDNKRLKEMLADTALSILHKGEDYISLTGLTVNFGYLFNIEKHGLEALFKVTTDKGAVYFAAQKDKLLRLNINESQFNAYTEVFMKLHG
jgi:hypothetical protein